MHSYSVVNLLFKPPEAKIFEKYTLKTNQNGSQNQLQSVISFLLKPPEAKIFEKYICLANVKTPPEYFWWPDDLNSPLNPGILATPPL